MQSTDAHPESCPVLKTADIISGKWTLLILRDLSKGINRFSALERSLAGISPKTLSERLKALEKAGIVTRKSYAEVPPRVEYTLTEHGLGSHPAHRAHARVRDQVARATAGRAVASQRMTDVARSVT